MSKAKPVVSATDKRKPPASTARGQGDRASFVAGRTAVAKAAREKLTVYVDEDVLMTLRVFCARQRMELSEATTAALRAYLAGKE